MNHVELFAGCGGLCLGLSAAGFALRMACELSPMAAETFAYNLLGENLLDSPEACPHSLWLSSRHPREDMAKRLREDPREYPVPFMHSDVLPDGSNLEGSLVVGDIAALNGWLEERPDAAVRLRGAGIDLVSGGPPCQSFSLAGLREKNNAKNRLPWEFVRFVRIVRPRGVLLENVTGILRPFTENGRKYHAWFEVAKSFAEAGYVPLALHVNAKFAGAAQDRPRFMLMAFRQDEYGRLKASFGAAEQELFASSEAFMEKLAQKTETSPADLRVHDLNAGGGGEAGLFRQTFLHPLAACSEPFASVRDAIGDLQQERPEKISAYIERINRLFGPEVKLPAQELTGHRFVDASPKVARRFRIHQAAAQMGRTAQREIAAVVAGRADAVSDAVWQAAQEHWFIEEDGRRIFFCTRDKFIGYLKRHASRKQRQRALLPDLPAPTAMGSPDDACHYSDVRTMTPREMARIQSFPDSFVFRSKTTTGGLCRRFEVPVYTQIGNAVPPLLAYAAGQSLAELLGR